MKNLLKDVPTLLSLTYPLFFLSEDDGDGTLNVIPVVPGNVSKLFRPSQHFIEQIKEPIISLHRIYILIDININIDIFS
jgi:hypothetical protein